MPILSQNTSILSKLHYIMDQKSIGYPFFPIFHEKITAPMPVFCQKNVQSLTHCSHAHILSKKLALSQKHLVSCHFFKFFMKNPLLSCLYLVKKCPFCQKYTILWTKKINRMPFFFSNFSAKNHCFHANIL